MYEQLKRVVSEFLWCSGFCMIFALLALRCSCRRFTNIKSLSLVAHIYMWWFCFAVAVCSQWFCRVCAVFGSVLQLPYMCYILFACRVVFQGSFLSCCSVPQLRRVRYCIVCVDRSRFVVIAQPRHSRNVCVSVVFCQSVFWWDCMVVHSIATSFPFSMCGF